VKTALKIAMVVFPVSILAFLILIIVGFASSCCMFYKEVELENVTFYEGVSDCFVAEFYWDGNEKEITIPDTYNKKPVTSLGGYYGRGVPTAFYITCKNENDIEEMNKGNFTLNIGKNINEIKAYNCLEIISYVNCSDKNETFYSKDGLLYYKSDDAIVEDMDWKSYKENEKDSSNDIENKSST